MVKDYRLCTVSLSWEEGCVRFDKTCWEVVFTSKWVILEWRSCLARIQETYLHPLNDKCNVLCDGPEIHHVLLSPLPVKFMVRDLLSVPRVLEQCTRSLEAGKFRMKIPADSGWGKGCPQLSRLTVCSSVGVAERARVPSSQGPALLLFVCLGFIMESGCIRSTETIAGTFLHIGQQMGSYFLYCSAVSNWILL